MQIGSNIDRNNVPLLSTAISIYERMTSVVLKKLLNIWQRHDANRMYELMWERELKGIGTLISRVCQSYLRISAYVL